jgi:hypothetical protein
MEKMFEFLFGTGVLCAWVQLIPMAISLASTIASGINTANNNKKQQARLDAEQAKNDAIFNKEYYTPELERTENVAMLNSMKEQLDAQATRNAKSAAINGSTAESALAAQDKSNKAYSDLARNIAGNASIRKSNLLAGKQNSDMGFMQLQNERTQANSENWNSLAQSGGNLAGSMSSTLSNKDTYANLPTWMKFKS